MSLLSLMRQTVWFAVSILYICLSVNAVDALQHRKILHNCYVRLNQTDALPTLNKQESEAIYNTLIMNDDILPSQHTNCEIIANKIRDIILDKHSVSILESNSNKSLLGWMESNRLIYSLRLSKTLHLDDVNSGCFANRHINISQMFELLRKPNDKVGRIIRKVQNSETFAQEYAAKWPSFCETCTTDPCCYSYTFRNEQWLIDILSLRKSEPREMRNYGGWFFPYNGYEFVRIDKNNPYQWLRTNDVVLYFMRNKQIWHYARFVCLSADGSPKVISKLLNDGDVYYHHAEFDIAAENIAFARKRYMSIDQKTGFPIYSWMSEQAKNIVNNCSNNYNPDFSADQKKFAEVELKLLAFNSSDRYAIKYYKDKFDKLIYTNPEQKDYSSSLKKKIIEYSWIEFFENCSQHQPSATYFALAELYAVINHGKSLSYFYEAMEHEEYKYYPELFMCFRNFLLLKRQDLDLTEIEFNGYLTKIEETALKYCGQFNSTQV